MSAKTLSGSDRYRARRRLRLRRLSIFFGVLFVILVAGSIWLAWRPGLRIKTITIYGADQSLAQLVQPVLAGTYAYIVPRNSMLFVPEGAIRRTILAAHAEVATVSIFREGLTGLSIKINERVPIARWCGLSPTAGVQEYCYVFDANGYIYAAADSLASTTDAQPLNSFALYDSLVGNTQEPLRATLAQADNLPRAFDFARQVENIGTSSAASSRVAAIIIRKDEVDDILISGTKLTYLVGDENNAYSALASASADYNLANGSVSYIDLRFPGKIYVKKKDASVGK